MKPYLNILVCSAVVLFGATSSVIAASSPLGLLAELDYGSFQGKYSATYNINYWRKIPFAAPPVGINRFRAPQPPLVINATYDTDVAFDYCPQIQSTGQVGSEDCLFLALYGRPWDGGDLKPVVVVFFGGGFVRGRASIDIPPSGYPILNASASNDMIFVYPNYRTNAFGFLPGVQISDDPYSDGNAGLLDQQAALVWVNKYISIFGGDPKNVTIQGQSAGGGGVVAQSIANGGKTSPRLFSKAMASSPYWPKNYLIDAPEAQWQYDTLVNMTGCSTAIDSLACLKSTSVESILNASSFIVASHVYNTSSYTWAPVIDGEFLTQSLSQATLAGEVNMDFSFGMYNRDEGQTFTPPGFSTTAGSGSPPFNKSEGSYQGWLRGFLPGLADVDFIEIDELYPANGSAETIVSYSENVARAGLVYRDVVLACPAFWLAGAAKTKGYLGEYSITPAKHASDVVWWNQVNVALQGTSLTYLGYTGAMASFYQTDDPNAHKLTNTSIVGVPALETGKQFVVAEHGFENVEIDMLTARCEFWRSVSGKIPI